MSLSLHIIFIQQSNNSKKIQVFPNLFTLCIVDFWQISHQVIVINKLVTIVHSYFNVAKPDFTVDNF